ncbi:DUF1456 family protein [Catenovulum sediminis]|uniref:DUF1456 family protein n=1 Tax=Catenovulum sediminis TaxID=1740262 RepID=A0ABV1RDI4_9ALTE|nr:DUF1456 family protein [Catenovulum sediminis]
MTNNDVLRRLRYVFNYTDATMIKIFALADVKVAQEQVTAWLKKDDDARYQSMSDTNLAVFLNGLIIQNRGAKEGAKPEPESQLTNNLILRKLKIALELDSEQILSILVLANFNLGKHELSAFFRKPTHKHYRECKDQVLRNFLVGLQKQYRGA